MDYSFAMRLFSPSLISIFLITLLVHSAPADPIELGVLDRAGEGRISINVSSTDATLRTIADRAFSLHGGFIVANATDAVFRVTLERASNSSVQLSVGSGKPYVEQLSRTVSGADLQNAVLRACDLVVEATLQSKGFFAGKIAFVGKQRGVSELYTSDLLFNSVRPLTRDGSLLTGP